MKKTFLLLFTCIVDIYANDYASLLFHGNCITCHDENKAVSAPSIIEIRQTYRAAFTKKEDFVNYMSKWVYEPKAQTSLMDGAIKKYKIMPLLGYDISTLKEITSYIYDTDFTKKHANHIALKSLSQKKSIQSSASFSQK